MVNRNPVDLDGTIFFDLKAGDEIARYRWKCIRCASCCRHVYVISIRPDDVSRWKQEGRDDIAAGLQIDMKCLAPAAVIPLGWYASHVGLAAGDRGDPAACEKAFIDENRPGFDSLIGFIIKNHDRLENKRCNVNFVHWFLPDAGYKDIFRPKDLDVIEEGIRRGLQYIAIMDLRGECYFLRENACIIHETKPGDCRGYPVKEQVEKIEQARSKFIETCKGLEKIG